MQALAIAEVDWVRGDFRPWLALSVAISHFEREMACKAIQGSEDGLGEVSYIYCRLTSGQQLLIRQLLQHPLELYSDISFEHPFIKATASVETIISCMNIEPERILWRADEC